MKKLVASTLIVFLLVIALCSPDTSLAASTLPVPNQFRVVINSTYAQISWATVPSEVRYTTIERSTDSGDFYTIATIYPGQTSYNDYGISNGHVYRYRAKNVNNSTSSAYTNEVEIIYLYPTSFHFTDVYSNQIGINWSYPTLLVNRTIDVKTIIERRADGESTWTTAYTAPYGELEYRDSGLKPNTLYYYRLKTQYGDGSYSSYFPSSDIFYRRTSIPLTSPVTGFAMSDTQIKLEWDSASLGGYTLILQKLDSTGTYQTLYSTKTADHYTDTSLTSGEAYTYRVYMTSDNGMSSPYSDSIEVLTETIPAPSNCQAIPVSNGQIVVTWDYSYDVESGFQVWRKEDSGLWQKAADLSRNLTTWTDTTSQTGKKYTYRVRAVRSDNVFSSFSTSTLINNADPSAPPELVIANWGGNFIIGTDFAPPEGIRYTIETRKGINEPWQDYYSAEGGPLMYYLFPTPGQAFEIRLRAENKGNISYGPIYNFYGSVPETPKGFKAATVGSSRVLLTWEDASEKEDGYNLYKVTNGGRELVKKLGKNELSYSDIIITPGATAKYELKAYNLLGESQAAAISVKIPKKPSFKDISENQWSVEAINTLYGLGAISQNPNGLYNPNRTISRAEFLAILLKAFDIVPSGDYLFTLRDVSKTSWYYPFVMTAAKEGILIPDESSKAEPLKALSKKDMAIYLNNLLSHKQILMNRYSTDILNGYSDSYLIDEDLTGVFLSLCGDRILPPQGGLTLKYNTPVTRAEAAAIILKLMKAYD